VPTTKPDLSATQFVECSRLGFNAVGPRGVRSLVETGEFQQLVGEFEREHLDAEAQRYLFASGRRWYMSYSAAGATRLRTQYATPLAWQYRNLNWSRSIARFA
jgi:hypothetical protein